MILGLDVSNHQGAIDWPRVAAAGYQYALCKATEGLDYVDPRHDQNVRGARAAGLYVGSYHFGHPSLDPVGQAERHALHAGKLVAGRLPCALDLEINENHSPQQLRDWAAAFEQRIYELTGRLPLLYTGLSFYESNLAGDKRLERDPVWIARYGPDPHLGTLWQRSSSGKVPGIVGDVDLDEYRGSSEQLRALAGYPPPPSPTPQPIPAGPAATPQEDLVQFVTEDGWAVYITNGVTETRHVESMHELEDLEHAGLAQRPVKRITASTLATLLKNAR